MSFSSQTPEDAPRAGAHETTQALVERLFRREYARIIAALVAAFGSQYVELAEEVTQETLLKALRLWPYRGTPAHPAAWLRGAARNLAIDHLRRERALREKEPQIAAQLEELSSGDSPEESIEPFGDEQLRMMFVCCDERLPRIAHAPLILKTLCGFGIEEIARAFLVSPEAIAQRLSRARQTLRDTHDDFDLSGADIAARLPSALEALYLLFSEGYNAHSGDRLIREELCAEALRLTRLLLTHKRTATPEVEALLALMLFQAARLATRVGPEGVPVLLDQQDRSRWDRALINEGFDHLQRSITDSAPTRYHLQAGIAAAHAAAREYQDTDWDLILRYYDDLLALDQSPVVAVNRAVALARAQGAAAGVRALRELLGQPFVERFHLYWVALGDLQRELDDTESARECYEKALALVSVEPERRLLEWKLAGLPPPD